MRYFLLIFLLPYCAIGYAQKYRVEPVTIADGLSQGFASSLLQDSRGFIWIGTLDGLNRYDGDQIKRFTANNIHPWALGPNSIYCMAEDPTGLLWLGTEKGLVVMDPYSERFFRLADSDPDFPGSWIRDIIIKKDGRIWVCTQQAVENKCYVFQPPAGLMRLIREGRIQNVRFQPQYLVPNDPERSPQFWLDASNDTIVFAIDSKNRLIKIDPVTLNTQPANPACLNYEKLGNYGMIHGRKKTINFLFPLRPESPDPTNTRCFLCWFAKLPGEQPMVYVPSDFSIHALDTASFYPKISTDWMYEPSFPYPSKTFIKLDKPLGYTTLLDQAGNLWLSTTGFGLRRISRNKLDYRSFPLASGIYNATILPDKRIWLGYRRPEKVLNLQTGHLESPPWEAELPKGTTAQSLLISRTGDWWMVTLLKDRFSLFHKDQFGQWRDMKVYMPNSGKAVPLLEDHRGNIWVAGTQGQVIRIGPGMQIENWDIGHFFPAIPTNELYGTNMLQEENGTLWISSNYGLVRVDQPEGKPVMHLWKPDRHDPSSESNWMLSLYAEPHNSGALWIGNRGGGLSHYDDLTGSYETFTENDGLANNVVYGILPDSFGYLWLSTNRGLSRFNLSNHTFSNFLGLDTELNTEFNTGAYFTMPTGELAFGGVDGLFLIRPQAEKQLDQPCVVELTQIKINGTLLEPNTENPDRLFTDQNEISLDLPFTRNNLILEFAALLTNNPTSVQYRYRTLGLDERWISIGHQHTVNLAAIPWGQYTIELQSIDASGRWETAPITRLYVTIHPPWYLSTLAWWLYAGLAVLILYNYIRYERRQLQLKYAGEINQKELERLKSLDDFKNRFFSYISHEFKTPLTIIMGQAKRLPAELGSQKAAIFQQGQSMLEMVDQMVDFIRLDNHKLRLNWRNGNVSDYIQELLETLHSLTDAKNIRLTFHTTLPELMMDFDPLRLKYIINNLLTNAIQHTPQDGNIGVTLKRSEDEQMQIEVSDTGEGISPEDLPNIFDRYYQGQSLDPQPHHFGLGLALVKDLLQLFQGKIEVDSRMGGGTIFTVFLPINQRAAPLEKSSTTVLFPENSSETESIETNNSSLPLLLVVEDNTNISIFLKSCLSPYFSLEFAVDGLIGYKKALATIPDLILTDVMMPGMDGYALTHQLKNHELTGHIPIVMLSARSGLSDRLTGQKFGADAYVGKPFDEQELILTLQNLYRLQDRWRQRYAQLPKPDQDFTDLTAAVPEQPVEIVRQTDAFMLKIYALFEEHYTQEEYDLPQLCVQMGMSPSQVHRKLAALSDQSPMQLLRTFRLQKAYDLLATNADTNVKEVCFQVGFKDPSHFSRLFSKTFGVAPSDVKKIGLKH